MSDVGNTHPVVSGLRHREGPISQASLSRLEKGKSTLSLRTSRKDENLSNSRGPIVNSKSGARSQIPMLFEAWSPQ